MKKLLVLAALAAAFLASGCGLNPPKDQPARPVVSEDGKPILVESGGYLMTGPYN